MGSYSPPRPPRPPSQAITSTRAPCLRRTLAGCSAIRHVQIDRIRHTPNVGTPERSQSAPAATNTDSYSSGRARYSLSAATFRLNTALER